MIEKLQYLIDHRVAIGAAFSAFLIAWTGVASVLAMFIKRPDPHAHWLKRLLFDLLVDTPAWVAALERAGILGGKFNMPGVPSRQPSDNPTPAVTKLMRGNGPSDAALVLLMAVGLVGMFAGCAGFKAPAYATLTGVVNAAGAARDALPATCQKLESAEVQASKSATEATARTGLIHGRCEVALTSCEASAKAARVARDGIYDTTAALADPKAALEWAKAALDAYRNMAAMLAVLGWQVPHIKGVN